MEKSEAACIKPGISSFSTQVMFDVVVIAILVAATATAHLLPFPLYYLEPMRLMLVLAMVHTTRTNSYLLAMVLPLLSWAVSGHPEPVKALIITVELVSNVAVYYWMITRLQKPFAAMLISIILAKFLCYLLYWPVFSVAFMVAESGWDFLAMQLLVTLILSGYAAMILRRK